MNFKPLFDRVLVEVTQAKATTSGGVYLPTTTVEKIKQGTVVAVGEGFYQAGLFVDTTVSVGDVVNWQAGAGLDMVIDGRSYLILREAELLGIQ